MKKLPLLLLPFYFLVMHYAAFAQPGDMVFGGGYTFPPSYPPCSATVVKSCTKAFDVYVVDPSSTRALAGTVVAAGAGSITFSFTSSAYANLPGAYSSVLTTTYIETDGSAHETGDSNSKTAVEPVRPLPPENLTVTVQ